MLGLRQVVLQKSNLPVLKGLIKDSAMKGWQAHPTHMEAVSWLEALDAVARPGGSKGQSVTGDTQAATSAAAEKPPRDDSAAASNPGNAAKVAATKEAAKKDKSGNFGGNKLGK